MKEKKRNIGLDIIRCLAILLVIMTHYYYYAGFDGIEMRGAALFMASVIRWACYICVPLFILLTGYLNTDKKPTKEYFKKIIPILGSYFLIALLAVVVRKFYLNEPTRLLVLVQKIFNFTAIEYAWYVEMYIGLFLLVPFLNILYKNIETKKQKQLLLLILGSLIVFESTVNGMTVGPVTLDLFPDWWTKLFPIFYYFVGSYMKEYQVKISRPVACTLFGFLLFFQSLFAYFYFNSKGLFDRTLFDGFSSLPTIFLSILVFLIFYQIDLKNKGIRYVTQIISKISFDMYLFSFIMDLIIYNKFGYILHSPVRILLGVCLFVPLVFTGAAFLSLLKYMGAFLIKKIVSKYRSRNREVENT